VGKIYGIKGRCYWEHPWGTHWELQRNMLGTNEKMEKQSSRRSVYSIREKWKKKKKKDWKVHELQ
jgi:hypothetical protein